MFHILPHPSSPWSQSRANPYKTPHLNQTRSYHKYNYSNSPSSDHRLRSISSFNSSMASSDNDMAFERFIEQTRRDLSAFFPLLLGFTAPASRQQNQEDQGQGRADDAVDPETQERVILINPFTQTMVVLGASGASGLDALLRGGASLKEGVPPATKASVEAMPTVEAEACGDGECAICLEGWGFDGGVKEMPCKHRFHGECIEKWLGMHGSCPVCRYVMPSDEEETKKKRDEGRVWVTFSMRNGSSRREEDNDSSTDGNRSDQETES